MKKFINFLSKRVFIEPSEVFYDESLWKLAFIKTFQDVQYHNSEISKEDVFNKIYTNQNELAIFLFRLAREIYTKEPTSSSLQAIHFLMRDLCACEIYHSNEIDVGFYVVHGVGTVIGSRNRIGKGFKIYQGCTIGHKKAGGAGNIIGDKVTCFAGAKIIGDISVGDNVQIGANTIITKGIPSNTIAYGNPLVVKQK